MPYDVVAYEADDLAMQLSETEEGLFHRMLRRSWMNGSIPADLAALADICRTTRRKLEKAWPKLSPLWAEDLENPGRLKNTKQERERFFVEEKRKRASASAKIKWSKDHKTNDIDDANAMRTQCERNASPPLFPIPSSLPSTYVEGNRGKDMVSGDPKYGIDFEAFWEASTRRGSKFDAGKAWKKLSPAQGSAMLAAICDGMLAWMQSDQWRDETKQPHISTWLNRRGWEEIVPKVMHGGNGNGKESYGDRVARENRETAARFIGGADD